MIEELADSVSGWEATAVSDPELAGVLRRIYPLLAERQEWFYVHLKEHGGKSAPQPVATPQFNETEAYLQNIERERKQAVSYEEYKRQLAEGRLR